MSTRYDELTEILGTGSAGTPTTTPAEGEQKQTSRRDELYSLLGGSTAPAPDTAAPGASTTQRDAVMEAQTQGEVVTPSVSSADSSPKGGASAATPQAAVPTAPLTQGSLAGEGRSAEQGTQALTAAKAQMTQSEAQTELDRLKPVLEQAKQYENEMGRYVSGAGQDESLYLSALRRRDALLKKYGYSSVDELNKAVMDYTLASGNELSFMQKLDRAGSAMEEGLKNTVLSGDWWKNVVLGGAEQWAGSQLNAAGTTAGNVESIGKEGAGMVYENELRARNDWATTLEEAKTGVIQMDADGIKEIENIIAYYDNILLPSLRSGVQAYETLAEDSAAAADEITAKGQQNTEKAKEGLGWGGKLAVDLLTQGTMMALDKATGAPNISMFTRGLGSGAQEARQAGSTAQEQIGYGAAVGTVEVLTNKLFDGLAGIYGKGAADDLVEATIAKLAKSRDGQAALRLLASGFNEGIEEILSDAVNPLLRTIYSEKSIKEEYSEEQLSQWLYDGLVGGIMGTGMTAINPNTYVLNTGDTQTSADQEKTGLQPQADGQAEEQTAGMAETPTAQTQEKSYPTVEELIQPIRQAGNAEAETVAPAAGGNAPVNAGAQSTDQGQAAGRKVMTREEQAQREAEWWANREKEAEKAYEDAKKRYEEALNGGTADDTDIFSSPEMRMVMMNMAKQDLEDVRNRRIPSPFSNADTQAAGTAAAEETPQSAAPTAPLAEEPLRAATQGRPYSQPGQMNTRQETQTQAAETAQNVQRATQQAETPPTTQNAAQAAPDALNRQTETSAHGQETTAAQNAAPAADNQTTGQREQPEGANAVRGFSVNIATDSAMEMALREDVAANPDLYKRLSNKETLQKAQDIFTQGLDTARTELERAIGAAQSGQKFPPEMVPLSRMVANELTRQGELTAARKIISDVAAELTGAGQLGQAGAILRDADPITVLDTLQNALDSINKEVSGKQGNSRKRKDAETTGAELENAVKDAAGKVDENEEIRNAVKRGIDRSRSGKGKGGGKQEPSMAEVLRDALKRDAFSRIKPKTTDPQKELIKSLKRFAMEKLPPKQGTRQKTAADVLSDYVKNQEMFTEAWEDAQQMLREDEEVKGNPVIEEILGGFVNEGINVNANYPAEIRGKIMAKALAEEAMNTGETKETIRNQYALGVSVEEIGGRIADSLIRQTGASGEIAETIRDAAAAYADRIISEDTKGAEARAEKLVNSAVVSVGETMRSLAKQGKTSKAEIKRAVADVLAFEYAVDQKTAEGIAERVYSEYDVQLKKSMDAEVQRRYGDKKQGEQTFLKNSIIEATNIGAFESEYAEKAADQLTKKAIQDLRTTVEKIALGNRAEKISIRDAVVSLFVDNYELSVEQARDIADVVKSQFDKMVGQAADRILERRFGEKLSRIAQKTDTVQKLIEAVNIGAFNSDYAYAAANKLFGLDKIKAGNWKAELTAEEIKQISETDFSRDGAFEAIQQQIAERLGREMPATLAEKLREIRKVGMLANPKTQVKNVAGNVPLAGERKIAEKLSGGLQELAVKAGIMSKEEQTRTLRVSKESKDLAKNVYENNLDRINRKGNKGELRGILKDTRTYFNKGLLQKGIEKATGHQLDDAALDYVRRFTYGMLEKGDAPFVKSAFIDSLAQYCEAQGIKSEADVTETAFSYALDQAMAATFKDASALAKLLNSIKDNAGIAGEALDVLFPFTTTPINIAKEFGKYSPLGYLQLLNAKGKSAAEVIDIASRATTGTAVVALGMLLRSLGFITGAADDDKDKAAHDRAKGISPYSILGKYSYEWMQPTGSALAMGAAVYDAMEDGGNLIESLSNGLIAAGDAYLEQSFYKDIIDLFKGYGSPTENMIKEVLTGTASQFIPTIVGATARTIDPTVRTSYTGGNIIDDILAQAKVKTPGLSKSAPASVNVRGEEVQRGNLGERIWDNFIAPWTTNRNGKTTNAVDKALDEVYEATGDKTIFRQVSPYKVDYGGESYQMTGKEREQFQKTQGQVHDDILQQIIDGGQWKNLSNGEKAKIMQRVNEYALDSAKRELVEARGNEYSSDWDDEAALTDISSYFVAKIKADKDGNGRISQEELWYYLGLQKNMPNSTKSELWDILTTGKTGYAQYAEKQK